MKKSKFVVFVLVLTLFLLEIMFRLAGFLPGLHPSRSELKSFWIDISQSSPQLSMILKPDEIGLLKIDTVALHSYSETSPLLSQIQESLLEVDFNNDGFRGREFVRDTSDKAKVLFIGDSFTFGYDAQPFNKCFVDQFELLNEDLIVYNAGIGGIDMASYQLLAEKYIPLLSPDYVFLVLYTNDGVYYDKQIKPNDYNDMFPTSAGVLMKENTSISPDSIIVFENYTDAYKMMKGNFSYAYEPRKTLKWLLNSSAFITYVAKNFYNSPPPAINVSKHKRENHSPDYHQRIKSICEKENAVLVNVVIPEMSQLDPTWNVELFQDMVNDSTIFHFPTGVESSHYNKFPRIHFNNDGHLYYANFLDSILNVYSASADLLNN